MNRPAPKPKNFDAMVDAWDNPTRFAQLVNDYYASLRPEALIDVTEPRYRADD